MMAAVEERVDLEPPIEAALDQGSCPHLAMLLPSYDDVPAALASFYGLGAKRNGWMFHRSLPGRGGTDRAALLRAGLEVERLEAERRFTLDELALELPPAEWARPWVAVLDEQLERGFEAVWWAPFPIGPGPADVQHALAYDRALEQTVHGRRFVTLCLYVVGDLDVFLEGRDGEELSAMHDGVLVPEPDGVRLVRDR
jgi:hypothetical protein